MTGSSGLAECSVASTSRPLRPGSIRSSTTTSTRSSSAALSPRSRPSRLCTRKPSASRPRRTKSTIPGSSSISSTWAPAPPLGPPWQLARRWTPSHQHRSRVTRARRRARFQELSHWMLLIRGYRLLSGTADTRLEDMTTSTTTERSAEIARPGEGAAAPRTGDEPPSLRPARRGHRRQRAPDRPGGRRAVRAARRARHHDRPDRAADVAAPVPGPAADRPARAEARQHRLPLRPLLHR